MPEFTKGCSATTLTVADDQDLASHYRSVRQWSETLCKPLETEDFVIQSMPDVSPMKWHLAHTSWFFETFVLSHDPGYRRQNEAFAVLFNSYYNGVGDQHPRAHRGLLSRPTVAEVFEYRAQVDAAMLDFLEAEPSPDVAAVIEVGLHHEQQHQELMLTDIKHIFWCNPLRPVYDANVSDDGESTVGELVWLPYDGGLFEIGHRGDGFCYDNESPAHKAYVAPFELSNRLVTNGEYLDFINDDGYLRHELWLSDGWNTVNQNGWRSPLYWEQQGSEWTHFTLSGIQPLKQDEPVCHISFYEADAFARWSQARLPTEFEWEIAARELPIHGTFAESQCWHPASPTAHAASNAPTQVYGDVWQWTASPYVGYPGYRPPSGALGEYNGKFMCNTWVLRGGSCATPQSHIRCTYRNFFGPDKRWQFSGLRLARS